jgi:DNA modification methylase
MTKTGRARTSEAERRAPRLPAPYLQDADFTLYNGDAVEVLRELPDESVQMCVTSPPFFGLRDYGVEGQIGLEETPEDWVASLVAVFEQVRRVLRSDGTLWVECGDSYNAGTGAGRQGATGQMADRAVVKARIPGNWNPDRGETGERRVKASCKTKDLIGQPFLLAFALREAGWYWRNVCIWHKPNPMPESVRDRFTVSHSYVLLFSKSPRYFFDAEAVREAWSENTHSRGNGVGPKQEAEAKGGTKHAGRNNSDFGYAILGNLDNNKRPPQTETLDDSEGEAPRGPDGRRATAVKAGDNSIQHRDGERWPNSGRNARSVWTIPTEPLPFEHYAAFPQALAERCIKAGSAPGDVVLDCFLGSGTAALVARRLGRRCIGIELNETYCKLAAQRTQQLSLEAQA